MSELSLKFLRGARKAIQVGGFDAQILRTVDGGVNVLDPLGPNLLPVTTSYDVRVFVDAPKTYYSETSGLVKIGDGVLYVDLLSEITNTETSITWFPQDGDILQYSNGKKQTLSNTKSPAANGEVVVTISTVTGLGT